MFSYYTKKLIFMEKICNFQFALRRTILATERTFNFSLSKRLTVKKNLPNCSTRNVRNLVEKSLKNVRHMSQSKLETIHQALPKTFLDFSNRQIVRILLYIWCMYVRQLYDIATRNLSIGIGGFHISIGRSNVRCRFIVIECICWWFVVI